MVKRQSLWLRRYRREGNVFVWTLAVLALVAGGFGVWLVLGPQWRGRTPLETDRRNGGSREEIILWFASAQEDGLTSEKRVVTQSVTMIERAKTILRELVAGPKTEAMSTVPAEVKIRDLFIDDQGTAYVDFTDALSRNHPGGPWSEMLTLRSIVQTLTANVPEIKRVRILIGGREVDTLAGHVDIRGPIAPISIASQR